MASISASRHTAAATRVTGSNRPAAPSSSSTPVTVTSRPGAGNRGGTIAMRSRRIGGAKWATPVSTNIAASPTAIAAVQLLTYADTKPTGDPGDDAAHEQGDQRSHLNLLI